MATEFKLSYTGSQINEKLNKIDSLAAKSELPTKTSDLTNDSGYATEQWVQEGYQPKGDYLTSIPDEYVTMEEVEELLGIEEEFSVTGEVVEFDVDVEPDTALQVISKIHRDETWGLSDKLVLHQVSGTNFVDFTSYLGGAGTVIEKSGLTATVNADSTVTISGTNTGSSSVNIIDQYHWSGEHSEKVYPAGTYTIPNGFAVYYRAAQYPANVKIEGAKNKGTVNIPVPFRVINVAYSVKSGVTVDATLPLGLFRGSTVPETGYEYYGQLHTVTFDSPIYDGEFNWRTGELKDTDGNTVGYYDVPEIKRLPGTNYFWTCWGENTVSNAPSDLGKVVLRLDEPAPEDTIPSICDFMLTPTTMEAAYSLFDSSLHAGGVFSGHEFPVLTTKGTLAVKDADGNVKYSKYIDTIFNARDVADVLTHKGLEKKWSGKFYLNKDAVSTTTIPAPYDGAPVNYVFVWEFEENEFVNTGIPAKLRDIPMASPCFINNDSSEEKINNADSTIWGGGTFPAFFSYNAETGKYTLTARGVGNDSALSLTTRYSKAYFYYQLETPYSLPFTFAMGIDVGDQISFEADTEDAQPYIDARVYRMSSGRVTEAAVDPTVVAFVPRNVEDAMDGMNNAARMLNMDDTAGGDATVQGYSWIGAGDGVTDYTVQIQTKLDELHNISNGGTINLGPGIYPISKSLIVYRNTSIIGCGIKTVVAQTADNTDAIIVNGNDITLRDFCIRLDGACTELTACVYSNSGNTNGDNGYPSNYYVTNLTMENIFMSGNYRMEYVDEKPIIGDVYNNYKGVGIRSPVKYSNYAHVDNVYGRYLMATVYKGGSGCYFNITAEFCKYAVYGGGINNQYFINGHSYYAGGETEGYVSMCDYVVYEDGHFNQYSISMYDGQYFRGYFYFTGQSQSNSYTINANYASTAYGSDRGTNLWSQERYVVDLGRANIHVAAYQNIPFAIGNVTKQLSGQTSVAISDPAMRNALSGAGVWGNISSNVAFDNRGLELFEVCRYPSEKSSALTGTNLPSVVSSVTASETNPIEIEIDIGNRPIYARRGCFIQFDHRYVASDFTVSFDTNGDGTYDISSNVKNNTDVTVSILKHQEVAHLIHRIKFTFTKPLQIENFTYADSGFSEHTIDYNPDGLIGICNIGITVNDYAGRSFLGECGGSLYGNVDMHQNTLKNLPNPVDAGDAVSKAYLEERITGASEFVLTDRTTGKKYNIYVDNGKLVMDEEVE